MLDKEKLKKIIHKGLWQSNPAIVQLLGMCPLLAVSTTLMNGLSLGLATMIVMAVANASIALFRPVIPHNIRLPLFMLIIAALVTAIDLLWEAYASELYKVVGLYVPLIVTNCIVLARVESFAYRNNLLNSTLDGLMMGLGGTIGLALLGTMREIIGKGTIGQGIEWFIPHWHAIQVLPKTYSGFLIANMPIGAFIGLSILIAVYQFIEDRSPHE